MLDFVRIAMLNVSEDEFGEIVRQAVRQAMDGDDKARTFLVKFLIPEGGAVSESAPQRQIVFSIAKPDRENT